MCTLFTFIAVLLFCVVFRCGHALFECSVPSNNSLIYLDLARLNALALKQGYHNSIHSPLLCLKGKDEECSEQKCCPDEVGCCSSNRMGKGHVRECGCKEAYSTQCPFPPPYAILATDECTADQKTKISACLREKRANEYLIKQSSLNAKNISCGENETSKGYLQDSTPVVVGKLEKVPLLGGLLPEAQRSILGPSEQTSFGSPQTI